MIKLRSWAKWDDDGLIEISVDKDVLKTFVKDIELQIAEAVFNKNYSLASELIIKRKALVEKLEEYNNGKSAD